MKQRRKSNKEHFTSDGDETPFGLQQQLLDSEQQSCISAGKNERQKPVPA